MSRSQSPVGAQHEVVGARAPDRLGDGGPLGGGRLRVAAAERLVGRLHLAQGARLGVDQREVPHVGQLELAGVDDLDGRAPGGGRHRARSGRSHPGGARKSDTTTARPRRRGGRTEALEGARPGRCCRRPRPGAGWPGGGGGRAGPGGRAGRGSAGVPSGRTITAPMRLPVRAVRKPTAATAARARSRFSHRAVPKSRLAEQSTRAHVSSSRSAMVSRTWGTVVRAVTFQSMRRTSSPSS